MPKPPKKDNPLDFKTAKEQSIADLWLYEERTMETVIGWISGGYYLTGLAKNWKVNPGILARWLRADKQRSAAYEQAKIDRKELRKESLMEQLSYIANSDVREVLNDQGGVKDFSQLSDATAASISSFELHEEFDQDGNSAGMTKKFKFWDKVKANELLGKHEKLFVDQVEHSGSIDLASGINAARDRANRALEDGEK